jgi:hypothetical protein
MGACTGGEKVIIIRGEQSQQKTAAQCIEKGIVKDSLGYDFEGRGLGVCAAVN